MSEFKEEPVLVLATKEEVLAAINENARANKFGQNSLDIFRVKSLWVISLIDQILENSPRDFAYNAEVKRLAEEQLGMPPQNEAYYAREGDTLSLLVYNAQCYRRSDQLIAAGFRPLSAQLIEEAYRAGKQIELNGGKRLNARLVSGKFYAMEPRKRKYAVMAIGQAAKLVDVTS